MNAPLPATKSLKALAQARLEQTSGAHLCRTSERTFAPEAAHLCSENEGQTCADDKALLELCKEACRGLALWPQELLSELAPEDIEAVLSNDPAELRALRTFAEGLASRLRTNKLPAGLQAVYTRLERQLAENPGLQRAVEVVDADADPVLLVLAVRGKFAVTLRIAREKYDAGRLIEVLDRTKEVHHHEET